MNCYLLSADPGWANRIKSTSISTDFCLWNLYVAGKSNLSSAITSNDTPHSAAFFLMCWNRSKILKCLHIEAWKKWLTFCRQYFQIDFIERTICYLWLDKNFTGVSKFFPIHNKSTKTQHLWQTGAKSLPEQMITKFCDAIWVNKTSPGKSLQGDDAFI